MSKDKEHLFKRIEQMEKEIIELKEKINTMKICAVDSSSFRDFMRKEGYAIMENDFKKGKLNL